MPDERDDQPHYTRYRARRRLLPRREQELAVPARAPDGRGRAPRQVRRGPAVRGRGWRRWTTRKRLLLGLLTLIVGWILLSVLLFLISSHFERTSPPGNVSSVLDRAGYPLTSTNNILVLGSDRRQKNSKE